MQCAAQLGGDGAQMAGHGRPVPDHLIDRALVTRTDLLDEIPRVQRSGVRALKRFSLRTVLHIRVNRRRIFVRGAWFHLRERLVADAIHEQCRFRASSAT